MDRVVSSLQTPPDWDEDERPRRDPFRRLAEMSEGVSPGYAGIVFGKNPLTLFSHIAAFLAMPARMAVGIVCIENTPDAIMSEIISCVSGIPADYLRQGLVPPPLFAALNTALSRIFKARLYFSYPMATDLESAISLTRWLKRRYRIEAMMIDSIEALTNVLADRTTLLRICEELQDICKNLGLCLVATCRSVGVYKSLGIADAIDADCYEW